MEKFLMGVIILCSGFIFATVSFANKTPAFKPNLLPSGEHSNPPSPPSDRIEMQRIQERQDIRNDAQNYRSAMQGYENPTANESMSLDQSKKQYHAFEKKKNKYYKKQHRRKLSKE